MATKRFKKGQWIISEWDESGCIDFIMFEKHISENDFTSSLFFRIYDVKRVDSLHRDEPGELMFYSDPRLKYPFRIATASEIKKYKQIIRNKGFKFL